MSDVSQATDVAGLARTTDGTLVDQTTGPLGASPPSTTPATTTTPATAPAPATDGKTLLTEPAKDAPKEEAKEPPKGAPEKYADYTVPEGYTLDPEVKTEADKIFKELGLPQEAAQKLVDFYTSKTTDAFNAPFQAYQDMTSKWRTESESHPDLRGKLGPGQEVNVRIGKALDSLGDSKLASDFRELMDLTGAGNHQAFIRVIDKFAAKVTEGLHVAGNGPSKAGQSSPNEGAPSAARAMYPNLPSMRGG